MIKPILIIKETSNTDR